MLKQKEKFKFKKDKNKDRTAKRVRNLFKYTRAYINPIFQKLYTHEKKKIEYQISIKITANNTFCSLKKKNRVLYISSAGKNKIKITKRKLKFNSRLIIENFLEKISKYKKKDYILINLSGPRKLRKKIIKQLYTKLKHNKFFIKVNALKCFNGCRPKKKRRKKRKGLRIVK